MGPDWALAWWIGLLIGFGMASGMAAAIWWIYHINREATPVDEQEMRMRLWQMQAAFDQRCAELNLSLAQMQMQYEQRAAELRQAYDCEVDRGPTPIS